tara:strand:+ start:152 stop:550 length:399 start_codon:yes stop_codon:yes gene_type:complete
MPLTINFANAVQDSVQIGDTAYFMTTANQTTAGNMINAATGNPMATVAEYGDQTGISEIGPISAVGATSITIDPIGNDVDRPSDGDFILFSKDNLANMSSLAGYYAEVKMENNSNTEVELFAISSEIVESSK